MNANLFNPHRPTLGCSNKSSTCHRKRNRNAVDAPKRHPKRKFAETGKKAQTFTDGDDEDNLQLDRESISSP